MSGPDRERGKADAAEAERIAQELAALGEEPLAEDDEALAFAQSLAADPAARPDIDIATVQTLAGWADAVPSDESLSELAQARVWRTIELRTKSAEGSTTPARSRSRTRPVLLGAVVALVAVAAGFVLVPVLSPPPTSQTSPTSPVAKAEPAVTAEELDVLSTQARAGLAALDRLSGEPRGTARVEALATDYARRLEAHEGTPG